MLAAGLPLFIVSAAPLGSALEGYGVHSKKEWAQTWGQLAQYVSLVALVVLGTAAAIRAGKPKWTAVGVGLTALFVVPPLVKIWIWHKDLDTIASALLKLSSTVVVLPIASYSTTPFLFALAACHLLPSILDPSKIVPE